MLPADLHLAAQGEWAELAEKRQASLGAGLAPEPVALQPLTLRCSDEWATMDPTRISSQAATAVTPLFVHEAAWQTAVCASWPHDEGVSDTITISVPIVFLNGSADPADPPSNVAAAAATMPNALTVVVPGGRARQPLGSLPPEARGPVPRRRSGAQRVRRTACAHDFASALSTCQVA